MRFPQSLIFVIPVLFLGCSSAPPVQKAADTKSYFEGAVYPGEIYKLAEDNTGAEQYRVFSHGSTGFVSVASVQANAEGRAKDFCGKEGKTIKVLQQQVSTPPHVLGNFPRAELIFICIDKTTAINSSSKPASIIKAPSDSSSSPSMDQAKVKCLDLGFKPGTDTFGQCILKLAK
jgi:hypothetical protein